MSAGCVVLTREQRDALYDSVKLDLSGIGDISLMLRARRGAEARELRQQYVDAMRLLDDLGWDQVDARERYEISMPAEQLKRTMRHHRELAAGSLRDLGRDLRDGQDPGQTEDEWTDWLASARACADDDLDVCSACTMVLESMEGSRPMAAG